MSVGRRNTLVGIRSSPPMLPPRATAMSTGQASLAQLHPSSPCPADGSGVTSQETQERPSTDGPLCGECMRAGEESSKTTTPSAIQNVSRTIHTYRTTCRACARAKHPWRLSRSMKHIAAETTTACFIPRFACACTLAQRLGGILRGTIDALAGRLLLSLALLCLISQSSASRHGVRQSETTEAS